MFKRLVGPVTPPSRLYYVGDARQVDALEHWILENEPGLYPYVRVLSRERGLLQLLSADQTKIDNLARSIANYPAEEIGSRTLLVAEKLRERGEPVQLATAKRLKILLEDARHLRNEIDHNVTSNAEAHRVTALAMLETGKLLAYVILNWQDDHRTPAHSPALVVRDEAAARLKSTFKRFSEFQEEAGSFNEQVLFYRAPLTFAEGARFRGYRLFKEGGVHYAPVSLREPQDGRDAENERYAEDEFVAAKTAELWRAANRGLSSLNVAIQELKKELQSPVRNEEQPAVHGESS